MRTQKKAQGFFWWVLFKQKADVDGSLRGPARIDSREGRAADRSVLKPLKKMGPGSGEPKEGSAMELQPSPSAPQRPKQP